MQLHYGISTGENFRKNVIRPLMESGELIMTIPDKPTSKNQKYERTQKANELPSLAKEGGA